MECSNINPFNTINIQNKLSTLKNLPHIIVCEIWEDYDQKKEETYIIKLKTGSVIYKLDSIVIRTTNGEHFGSTITCNNQELVFDGASKKKLNNFNWKSKINKNEKWSFKSNLYSGLEYNWNFKNGYQIMFYYRV